MNTQSTEDRADEALRALLAQADPERAGAAEAPTHLLERVRAGAAADSGAGPTAQTPSTDAPAGPPRADAPPAPAAVVRPSFLTRHWQGALMAAASVAALALAAGTVLPGLAGSGTDSAGASSVAAEATDGAVRSSDEALGAPEAAVEGGADMAASGIAVPGADAVEPALVRYGSLLVGTEDVDAARDSFVATVLTMGGRVTSETVVTEGGGGGGPEPYLADSLAASREMGMSYPYPWYPTGPGIWLSVQVPVDRYDQAMEAARDTGEVVQMQQSSYDVGAQISDVDARIAALEASLARLTALMDEASDITDVISLEQAISQRQSELDALRAQQRDLANQTAMSQISLTLMSPEDARQSVDPTPDQSWWESFLEGLGQFWTWLGSALLIISPLLLAMGVIWWVRRRQRRSGDAGGPASTGPPQE